MTEPSEAVSADGTPDIVPTRLVDEQAPEPTDAPRLPPRPLDANFNRFWTGQALAQVGTRLGWVAMPVLSVQLLHATEEQLGYLNAAATAAFLLVGLPAGAWVDRWFKHRVMVWSDAVRVVAAAAVPALWFAGVLQLWQLYVISAVIGVATVFFDVAYQSYIPMLVDDEQVARANARLESTAQVAQLAGPGVGGLLLKVISAPALLVADALGYLASLTFLLVTRDHEAQHRAAHPRPPETDGQSLRQDIAEGLRFVWNHPALRRITACTSLSNLASTMVFTLMPILVLRHLGLSPFVYGLIMVAGAAGGLLGATLSAKVAERLGTADAIRFGTLLFAGVNLLVPIAVWWGAKWPGAVMLAVADFASAAGVLIYNINQVSLRQRLCPKHLLGRMNASIRFVVWGVMPLSALATGWLGRVIGLNWTMTLGAALGFVCLLPIWWLARVLPRELAA